MCETKIHKKRHISKYLDWFATNCFVAKRKLLDYSHIYTNEY